MRIVAVVTEEAHLVRNYEHVWFLSIEMATLARRFAPCSSRIYYYNTLINNSLLVASLLAPTLRFHRRRLRRRRRSGRFTLGRAGRGLGEEGA